MNDMFPCCYGIVPYICSLSTTILHNNLYLACLVAKNTCTKDKSFYSFNKEYDVFERQKKLKGFLNAAKKHCTVVKPVSIAKR